MQVLFDKATQKDVVRINELLIISKETMNAMGVKQWNNAYPSIKNIEEDISNGTLYVLRDELLVVQCTGTVKYSDSESLDKEYLVQRIMTNPLARGKGLSTQLLWELEKKAKVAGATRISSTTSLKNTAMIKVFLKNHFIKVGEFMDNSRIKAGVFIKYSKRI